MSIDKNRKFGLIKFYNPNKGFGFILMKNDDPNSDNDEKVIDIFFHISHFKPKFSPSVGQIVEFYVVTVRGKLNAQDCVVLSSIELHDHEDIIFLKEELRKSQQEPLPERKKKPSSVEEMVKGENNMEVK